MTASPSITGCALDHPLPCAGVLQVPFGIMFFGLHAHLGQDNQTTLWSKAPPVINGITGMWPNTPSGYHFLPLREHRLFRVKAKCLER